MSAVKFEKGKRYRVIRAGAHLTGMQPAGRNAQQGWRQDLNVGDILTCSGSSMTFGDGVPALKWTDENGDWLANDCTFTPVQGGMWGGQVPEDGYLEEVL